MQFNTYQKQALTHDLGQKSPSLTSPAFIEKVLGLTGEAGETADKIKKIIRDKSGRPTPDDVQEIQKELGDVLWYIAAIAHYLDLSLDAVADQNLKKLASRHARHQLHGSGDNR